jgi:hypothetical protein
MLDDAGRCAAVVSGPAPSCIGQTSVASEWCAAAVVAHLAVDLVDGAQDCKGVVSEWAKPLAYRLRPSSVHAGQSRELLAHKSASLVALRWIKGHVEEEAAVGEDARRDARGNGTADAQANAGRARHLMPPDWLTAKVAREVADAQAVILYAARVLPLWPRAAKEELRAARPHRPARSRKVAELSHDWVCLGSKWQCRRCLSAAFSRDAWQRRAGEECSGGAQSVGRGRRPWALHDGSGRGWRALPLLRGLRSLVHRQAAQSPQAVRRFQGQGGGWLGGAQTVTFGLAP